MGNMVLGKNGFNKSNNGSKWNTSRDVEGNVETVRWDEAAKWARDQCLKGRKSKDPETVGGASIKEWGAS